MQTSVRCSARFLLTARTSSFSDDPFRFVERSSSSPAAQKLPHGIQTIRQIYNGRYSYVDQTGYLLRLLRDGKHYFIARPEKSGKSLFLNTLEEVFEGSQYMFSGTEIGRSNYNWETHPVLLFDFSQINSRAPGQFEKGLIAEIKEMAKLNKISITGAGQSFQFMLKKLVQGLYEKGKNGVVVLVDEYDNPIANRRDTKLAEKNQDVVDDFFATLKSLDRYLKFTFVVGIDKSIIANLRGANYLKDISTDPEYDMFLEFGKDVAKLTG